MDQLQDLKNTYKCSICCALQPAKPATQEALSARHKPPQKASRDWDGEYTKSAWSHQQTISPEIDNNVMLVNSQVVCFLTEMWPKHLTSLRLSCFFMFHKYYAQHSLKNTWIFPTRKGKKGSLYKELLTTLLSQAARHTPKKTPSRLGKKNPKYLTRWTAIHPSRDHYWGLLCYCEIYRDTVQNSPPDVLQSDGNRETDPVCQWLLYEPQWKTKDLLKGWILQCLARHLQWHVCSGLHSPKSH